ncbi:non-ribosomal peptide synthetase [Variovorax sp. SG517]|uniref:non-ribosomal peptide synthetase n=1 Tax=unclassified Variovorax TaxID=663243 RepID=UPI00159EA579|nr:amino acid adenylation domain-containing protein [Variovorax sp. SG517]
MNHQTATPAELLDALASRGLSLRLDGERLALQGDARLLADSALVQALRERKAELIALLREGRRADPLDYRIDYRIEEKAETITPQMLPLLGLALGQDQIDRLVAKVPGGVRNVQDIYPLAPLQEGILFHHRLHRESEDGGDAYVMPTLLRFDSRQRLEAFVQALREVISRHDILRTSVHWEELQQPVQLVQREAGLEIAMLAPAPVEEARERLGALADPRRCRLDVRRAPMLRGHAIEEEGSGRWLLQLLHHHLILDHTASQLLVSEVLLILQGRRAELPAPVPFRHFVAQARQGGAEAGHEAYFRRVLGDVDATTAPFGLDEVRGDGSGVLQSRGELEPGLARRLREQARLRGVGAAGVFHLAWALVLACCSARDDVVFGTVLFGRLQAGAEATRAMGMFLNTLPLRVRIDGEADAALRRVHADLAELLRHEHASLSLARRCSGLPADAPLFTSLLNYRYSPRQDEDGITGVPGIESLGGHDRTNYPFVLHVDDHGDGFGITAEIDRCVDARRIRGFVEKALRSLVDALEARSGLSLRRIDVLPEDERRRVMSDFNATDADHPRGLLLHQLFERQAAKRPDATALVFEGRSLSYAELDARANRLARRLRALGVVPDARIGIFMQRSEMLVVALLAVLKAGGAYLPLDPSHPPQRLLEMIEEAGPVAVLADAELAPMLSATVRTLPVDRDDLLEAFAGTTPGTGLHENNLAYVIYTSGSTGRPKGVMNEHRGIVNRLHWMQQAYALTPDDVVLQKTPLGFDVSVWEFFWPLMAGARLVLARPDGHRDPAYLCELIRASGVTTLHFVPSMLQLFLARLDDVGDVAACKSLRRVVCSGEALSAGLARRCRERLPHARLHNLYGPTEAAVDVSAWTCGSDDGDSVPIGRPVANTRLYLLDDALRPVPIGVAGELYIGGVQVARGYLNQPELTAQRFIADSFGGSGRLYRTGDLGRWRADGAIEYLGRCDFQIKLRGQRIEPGEIEARLRAIDGVTDAVVLAREDRSGTPSLVAYVVPASPDEALEPARLRGLLAEHLPEHMLPAAYVCLAALPLGANGKLDRKALPAPDGEAFDRRAFVPPQGEVEQALAEIWSRLLGVERIGRHDSFFALGGHSLLAVQMLEQLRRRGWAIDVRAVFDRPGLAAMAAAVRTAPDAGEIHVPHNAIPAHFAQQQAEWETESETEEFRL